MSLMTLQAYVTASMTTDMTPLNYILRRQDSKLSVNTQLSRTVTGFILHQSYQHILSTEIDELLQFPNLNHSQLHLVIATRYCLWNDAELPQ